MWLLEKTLIEQHIHHNEETRSDFNGSFVLRVITSSTLVKFEQN